MASLLSAGTCCRPNPLWEEVPADARTTVASAGRILAAFPNTLGKSSLSGSTHHIPIHASFLLPYFWHPLTYQRENFADSRGEMIFLPAVLV